jgi:4-oxalocrotonate tautomerase
VLAFTSVYFSESSLFSGLRATPEDTVPHVIVKMYSGCTEAQKQALAAEITKAVKKTLGSSDGDVSISIEDVAPNDWTEKVYRPDIAGKPRQLYKKPGYDPPK